MSENLSHKINYFCNAKIHVHGGYIGRNFYPGKFSAAWYFSISFQIDVKMAQIQQFIRSLATANPQQQEQLLQRVPLQKRAQVLMRAQQIRQQMQQQQQQQQGYNPGGGGMMGTGGECACIIIYMCKRGAGER